MGKNLHAIIPAGGAGTRLWPLSRADHPKFLLPLTHPDRSMLTQTVARLSPLCDSITIVTGAHHAQAVGEHARDAIAGEDTTLEILVEPCGRNSMPAIALAAERIRARCGDDALVASFAADHTFADEDVLRGCVQVAMQAAGTGEHLVTLGVEPTYAATGFGYIKPASPAVDDASNDHDTAAKVDSDFSRVDTAAMVDSDFCGASTAAAGATAVDAFVEKPDAATATGFVQQGYLWNAGIFVATAGYLHRALRTHLPALAADLTELAASWLQMDDTSREVRWSQLPSIAIDYALAEPEAEAGRVLVVPLPANAGWADVGDLTALEKYQHPFHADVTVVEAQNVSAYVGGREEKPGWEPAHISVVGVDDCIVVQTPDGIVITSTQAAQSVGKLPAILRDSGRTDLL
ncbi:MAG: sugar phosphate nucleotidyltransferase [Actinomycetaceae bacterium]|nr:sugar phosphate nucleotidyltransferase [Actinomycetaceae bacterium]